MDMLRITGGRRLSGRVPIAGAKNAALPALAATLLTEDAVELSNLPRVRDVRTMLRVLEQLGAEVHDRGDGSASIRVARLGSFEAPYDLVKTMRASVLALGPLVARFGRARVSLPGGCAIGERPIDLHIDGLHKMGAAITLEHGYVEARAERLRGATIELPFPTVTGTENLMMAATLASGTTRLFGCAREPEIVDLADLLRGMGASIAGDGTDDIVVEGGGPLHGATHRVIPDRIEAATYLIAGALVGDGVTLTGARADHLDAVIAQLRSCGVAVAENDGALHVSPSGETVARDVATAPHPGFPTDAQAQYMTLMTQARGTATIEESVFEHRFMHVGELTRMGAPIRIDGRRAVVSGPAPLTGAQVMATDLRASACLVLAGLVADGATVVDRVYHLDRGYEAMERKLGALGASIERIRP
ncbi:MAG TPA: UDP-N-acetylglucosamine 1-carboxyvinyltransferase [Candidatus Polarisedimenticolaceae bacterium]|nr:UDP-N-acetylglucosamine 1-carboxyvinyltransferase [Candidatus Polarisedimenticolaceae bacterium]